MIWCKASLKLKWHTNTGNESKKWSKMYSTEAGSEEKIPKREAKNDPQFTKSHMIGAGTRYGKQLSSLTVRADTLRRCIKERDKRINELEDLLRSSNERADELERMIVDMQQSLFWQLLSRYQSGFVERVLPLGTGRREKYDLAQEGGRILVNKGWRAFCRSLINPRNMESGFNSEHSGKEASLLKERNGQNEYNLKKYILLKNAEIRADKNSVKTELENIIKMLNAEI